MNASISKTETKLDVFLRPVTTVEIFYAVGIDDSTDPADSYNQAVRMAREIPASRVPFQVPEQFKNLTEFKQYREVIENFPYSDDTNPSYLPTLKSTKEVVSHTQRHINPETTLTNNRANCKGLSTLAIVLGRHIGIPSRYVKDFSAHVKFELYQDGLWTPHNHNNFDRGGSIFEPRDEKHVRQLPIRYQKDGSVRRSEKKQFGRLYLALLHELNRLN